MLAARREEIDWVDSVGPDIWVDALPASQLFPAMPPLEAVRVLVSIMMPVSFSNKGKPLKLRHHDISRAYSKEQQGNLR